MSFSVELTQHELTRLLAMFVLGKTEVLEDDCLTLVQWAQAHRLGNMLVDLILEGQVRPVVKDGAVYIEAVSAQTPTRTDTRRQARIGAAA